MKKIDLKQNFARIVRTLESQGLKPTNVSKAIGYTTTAQMNNILDGDSVLSTKAIIGLIENLNVNPTFLFLGKGDIFITNEEEEINKLRRENQEWIQRHNEAVKTVMGLHAIIKELDKRNADLIDISAAAIKYHKGQKEEESGKEAVDSSLNTK